LAQSSDRTGLMCRRALVW